MPHRITARAAGAAAAPRIDDDPAILAAFLSDAAHVPGGHATGVTFPRNESDVAALVQASARVLPVGAQSSLTGGATPRGDVVLSTRALTAVSRVENSRIVAEAGVPLATLQRIVAARGFCYPPVPTFDGAFVGGTIATNAAGAATFKYGSTRDWVDGLVVVLADGSVLEIARGAVVADEAGVFEVVHPDGAVTRVPVPSYQMPKVAKLSAGFFAQPGMDLIDLFVGSEGVLGVVVSATLRLVRMPRRAVALVRCAEEAQAIAVTRALAREAAEAWAGRGPLDVAAIEYMDAQSLATVPDDAFARAAVRRPADAEAMLVVQLEVADDPGPALEQLSAVLAGCGVADDPAVAAPGDDRAAQRLFELREAVPTSVNALVAAAKARVDPDIQKTAGDMVVPIDRLADSLALYRETFDRAGLRYAIWGHVSDGNLHPNVIPRSLDDVRTGSEALMEIARGVIAMGGAPLAEHGVGRSPLKQAMLRELYGESGIEQMRAVKRALDPEWKLAPGVLFTP